MKRLAILSFALLAGCDDMPRARTEAEITEISQRASRSRIIELEAQIINLESRLAIVEGEARVAKVTAEVTANAHDSLVKTFNSNVNKDNEDAVKDMTRRGACGRQWLQDDNGNYFQTNKACTMADLKK
jgi:outer membrane murein-binding lipoprotein Lpp